MNSKKTTQDASRKLASQSEPQLRNACLRAIFPDEITHHSFSAGGRRLHLLLTHRLDLSGQKPEFSFGSNGSQLEMIYRGGPPWDTIIAAFQAGIAFAKSNGGAR